MPIWHCWKHLESVLFHQAKISVEQQLFFLFYFCIAVVGARPHVATAKTCTESVKHLTIMHPFLLSQLLSCSPIGQVLQARNICNAFAYLLFHIKPILFKIVLYFSVNAGERCFLKLSYLFYCMPGFPYSALYFCLIPHYLQKPSLRKKKPISGRI